MMTKAKFECTVPDLDKFEVRTNVPLPPGYRLDVSNRQCPFTVVAPDGSELMTQYDIVSRLPNGEANVVQVMAICDRGTLAVNSRQTFSIIEKQQASRWWGGNQVTRDLLLTPNAITLRATDATGSVYESPVNLEHDLPARLLAIGSVRASVEVAGVLTSTTESLLPHLGGFQAIFTGRHDQTNVLELNLSYHNGLVPNPISDIYFERLELILPLEWRVISEWPEPFMAEGHEEDGQWVVPLISALADEKSHLLMQKDNRDWRLYLHPVGAKAKAVEIAAHKGWGVVRKGENLWSWHNSETANYQAQQVIAPTLDHVSNLAASVTAKKTDAYAQLAVGTPAPHTGGGTGELGYRNPAGVPYGGMTGGMEIHEFEGLDTLAASRSEGLLFHRVMARRYGDRQRGAYLYEYSGKPIELEDYLSSGEATWKMFNSTFQKQSWPNGHLDDDEPFNFDESDTALVDFVEANNLKPGYEDAIRGYDPIDDQHLIRRTKDLKTLVWLDNDYLAKRHLLMHAESMRMTYLDSPNGKLSNLLAGVAANPNKGGAWGRAEAHAIDLAASVYAIADNSWRNRWSNWFNVVRDISVNMQGGNGLWDRHFSGKVIKSFAFNEQYSVQRPNEHELMIHALWALYASVFPESVELRRAIIGALIGTWMFLWNRDPITNAPGHAWWDTVAVGSLDSAEAMWTTPAEHPPEQYVVPEDGHHVPTVLGYMFNTFWYSPIVRNVFKAHFGTTHPLALLEGEGLTNLTNRGHLLALLQ